MKNTISLIIACCLWIVFVLSGFAQDEMYQPGIRSIKFLTETKKQHPDNPVMSYYLGWAYFRNGRQEAAIDEWEAYLKKYPATPWADLINRQLTLVKINQSAAYAKITAQQDPMDRRLKINPDRIVIFNFLDRSYTGYHPFSKGMADVIIHDLANVPGLRVVSRLRMQALVHEIQVGESSVADSETAYRIGRLLLAGYAVWGEFTDITETRMTFQVHMTETEHGTQVADFTVTGAIEEPGLMEKDIVSEILRNLRVLKNNNELQIPQSLNRPVSVNSKAFMAYARGLDYLDQRDFIRAKEAFKNAVQLDGKFHLAQKAAAVTPEGTMIPTFIEPELFAPEPEVKRYVQDQNLPDTGINEAQDRTVLNVIKWLE